LTFSLLYSFSENFVLPLSHDEVVHGKRSIVERVPGDDVQKFSTLRSYLAFMWAHPGKKLLFMGIEFGQRAEWNHDHSLDWHLLQSPLHSGTQALVRDLNHLYRDIPALHQRDTSESGFEWVDANDHQHSVFSFWRHGNDNAASVLCLFNFTPMAYRQFRIGVPHGGWYKELLNTDALHYGGGGQGNFGGLQAEPVPCNGQPWSLQVALPSLGTLFFKREF
jgi:1,4-alpha-glucan branching enzyme